MWVQVASYVRCTLLLYLQVDTAPCCWPREQQLTLASPTTWWRQKLPSKHVTYVTTDKKKKTKTNEENLKTRPRRFTSNCSTQFWLRRAEYKWLAMFSAALYLWKSLNTTHVSFYFALIYVWRYCDNNKRENKNHLFHLLGYCMAVTAWYSNHSATNKNSALEILLFRTQSHIK